MSFDELIPGLKPPEGLTYKGMFEAAVGLERGMQRARELRDDKFQAIERSLRMLKQFESTCAVYPGPCRVRYSTTKKHARDCDLGNLIRDLKALISRMRAAEG